MITIKLFATSYWKETIRIGGTYTGRSSGLNDLVKKRSDSAYDSVVYDLVKTRLSKSQVDAE